MLWFLCNVEEHYVDNEQEAVDFINNKGRVQNTKAFLMPMAVTDTEQDCNVLSGSNSMFEFRYGYL